MDTHRRSRSLSRSPSRMNSISPERSVDGRENPTDPNPDEGRGLDSNESGLPRMECSTPLPNQTVSVASNAETKERAAASQLISAALSEDGSNLQMDSFSDTPSNPPTAELLVSTAKMRLPRNKSLLESINAHLGRNTHGVELAPTGSRRGLTGISSRDRLSNPTGGMPFSLSSVPDSNQPEILRKKGDSPLDPPNSCQERQDKQESANADMTLEGRARLLARLNREKREAELRTDLPGSSYSRPFGQEQSSRSSTTSLTDLEEREAKLRGQARLRARVAAEKRLAGNT